MQKSERVRVISGGMTAMAGLCVAIAMRLAGGDLARHLPEGPWFHVAALIGAGLAGVALADGFGRRGWLGGLGAVVAAPVATAVGAALAAAGLTLCYALVSGLLGQVGPPRGILTSAPALGLLAVGDGIMTSVVVAVVWVASMLSVHVVMLRARHLDALA